MIHKVFHSTDANAPIACAECHQLYLGPSIRNEEVAKAHPIDGEIHATICDAEDGYSPSNCLPNWSYLCEHCCGCKQEITGHLITDYKLAETK